MIRRIGVIRKKLLPESSVKLGRSRLLSPSNINSGDEPPPESNRSRKLAAGPAKHHAVVRVEGESSGQDDDRMRSEVVIVRMNKTDCRDSDRRLCNVTIESPIRLRNGSSESKLGGLNIMECLQSRQSFREKSYLRNDRHATKAKNRTNPDSRDHRGRRCPADSLGRRTSFRTPRQRARRANTETARTSMPLRSFEKWLASSPTSKSRRR
jgi:hypothetical protein